MPPVIELKRPQKISDISEFIKICIENGQRWVFSPPVLYDKYLCILAIKDGIIEGGISCLINYDDSAELDALIVEGQLRGEGIESILLGKIKDDLKKLGIKQLSVTPNKGEEPFYMQNGFSYDKSNDYMVQYL